MKILVIGGGKIARGFLGHLLFRSGHHFFLVEYNAELVRLLNEKKSYQIRLLGEKITTEEVSGFTALSYEQMPRILDLIASEINLIFISVGGKNLSSVANWLVDGLLQRFKNGNKDFLNIILGENWIKPANIIISRVYQNAEKGFSDYLDSFVGISESVIMRSAIEPTQEVLSLNPTAVNVQDFWHLPVDASRIKGKLPYIMGMELLSDFGGFLDKKFYTYNAANGTVSYLGNLKGYTYISDAARDDEILAILSGVYQETATALCCKHGLDFDKQMEFTQTSLAKLQNKYLVDYIERNARDPLRKLGPHDRLVGPARLVLEYGGKPAALATSIAAAIHYKQDRDPFAEQLNQMRKEKGIEYILENVCKLTERETLLKELIFEKTEFLRQKGWIT